jgi:hypothetical protein
MTRRMSARCPALPPSAGLSVARWRTGGACWLSAAVAAGPTQRSAARTDGGTHACTEATGETRMEVVSLLRACAQLFGCDQWCVQIWGQSGVAAHSSGSCLLPLSLRQFRTHTDPFGTRHVCARRWCEANAGGDGGRRSARSRSRGGWCAGPCCGSRTCSRTARHSLYRRTRHWRTCSPCGAAACGRASSRARPCCTCRSCARGARSLCVSCAHDWPCCDCCCPSRAARRRCWRRIPCC